MTKEEWGLVMIVLNNAADAVRSAWKRNETETVNHLNAAIDARKKLEGMQK